MRRRCRSEMRVVPVEEPQRYGVVVGVTEQPAPASGVVVGVLTEQPGASSGGAARGVVDQTLAMLDGLLSTEEISGDYCCCFFPFFCNSMTVVPHGPDMIETWHAGCLFLPCWAAIGPIAEVEVRTRNSGTNAFRHWQHKENVMTFSADGTASGCYKKRPGSQKRTFQKVDARDLAGDWRGCFCIPIVLLWPFSPILCTTKKAFNKDQYAESGLDCRLALPFPFSVESTTRTRRYVNGYPTNWFAKDGGDPRDVHWHRDPGCAGSDCFFAKKVG